MFNYIGNVSFKDDPNILNWLRLFLLYNTTVNWETIKPTQPLPKHMFYAMTGKKGVGPVKTLNNSQMAKHNIFFSDQ